MDDRDGERLTSLVRNGGVLVLTGAGLSTDSGIPDYRGREGIRRVMPMQYAEFVGSLEARQRYWARSFVGLGSLRSRPAQRRSPRGGPP